MKAIVYIAVEDWEGDEIVLAQQAKRITIPGEADRFPKVGKALVDMTHECAQDAAEQVIKLAEDAVEAENE